MQFSSKYQKNKKTILLSPFMPLTFQGQQIKIVYQKIEEKKWINMFSFTSNKNVLDISKNSQKTTKKKKLRF